MLFFITIHRSQDRAKLFISVSLEDNVFFSKSSVHREYKNILMEYDGLNRPMESTIVLSTMRYMSLSREN